MDVYTLFLKYIYILILLDFSYISIKKNNDMYLQQRLLLE